MMNKKLLAIAVLVILVLLGVNVTAPTAAEYGLYRSLSERMTLAPENVQVEAQPGITVLTGHLDKVHAGGTDFRVGKLQFQSFDCTLEDVRFSPWQSILDGRLQAESAARGELTATVTSDALRQYLKKQVKGTEQMDVTFSGDEIHIQGKIRIGGYIPANADITGHFAMEGTKLLFVPADVRVSARGIQVSAPNLAQFEVYDFADFPLHMVPDSVTLQDGLLTLHGTVSNR